jgi:hypothetical protein
MLNMKTRKLRNWLIGFLLALTTFALISYFAIDVATEWLMKQIVPQVEWVESVEHNAGESITNESKTGKDAAKKDVRDDVLRTDEGSRLNEAQAQNKEKVFAVQDQLSFSEKMLVSSIVLDTFSADELEWLQKLLSGGLTIKEKKRARDLFIRKLSEEQYNRLIEVAKKYGLSKGKTYREVQQE